VRGRAQWRFALQPILRANGGADVDDEDLGPPRLASQMSPGDMAAIEAGLMAYFDHLTPAAKAGCRVYVDWLRQAVLGIFPETENSPAEPEGPTPDGPSLRMVECCQASPFAARDLQALGLLLQALRSFVEAEEMVVPSGVQESSWSDFRAEWSRLLHGLVIPADPRKASVRFGTLETGRAQAMDHLFVLGLAEGEFPLLPAPDVLYAPRERENQSLPLIHVRAGEQASLWWQVLSSCRKSLTLLRPRLDEKGAPWLPSSYWEAAVETVKSVLPQLGEEVPPIVAQPGWDEAASANELLVALANGGALRVPFELLLPWQSSQAAYQLLQQRQSWNPVPAFEGILETPAIRAELDQHYGPAHRWSASRLNRYGSCPYSYFAQVVLGLEEQDDPESGFDPMQRGTLLHAILQRLFNQLTAESIALTPANLAHIATLLENCCANAFERAPERYGFQPGPMWRYEQEEMRRMLLVLLQTEAEQNSASPRFYPYQQELRFGIHGSQLACLRLEGPTGTSFLLHGVIDRLDRDQDGCLRLIDYKSGSSLYGKPDLEKGLAFQSPLYALAAEQLIEGARIVETCYLHIPKRKTSGRLVFSGRVEMDETVRKAVERAEVFVQNIRQGLFPPLPAQPGMGSNGCADTCGFASLCRADRHAIAKARRGGIL
jgi:RecB family exonuclease